MTETQTEAVSGVVVPVKASTKITSRKQLLAAREAAAKESKKLKVSYWPHQGEREIARRLKRLPK